MNESVSIDSDFPAVPADLAEWVGAVRLTGMALEATEVAKVPSVYPTGRPGETCSSRMLLTLMAYAYARGIHSSQDVEDATERLPDLRYLASGDQPTASVFRRFRRQHWTELLGVLSRILVAVTGVATAAGRAAAELEAEDRMVAAVQADSLASE